MAKNNRTCCVCGKEYSYCPTCTKDLDRPEWMIVYCSENCKKVYEACAAFSMKQIDKKEAKIRLSKCDLSNKGHFSKVTQKIVSEIMAEEPKANPVPNQNYNNSKKNHRK